MLDPLKALQAENAELRRELEDLRSNSERFLSLAAHDLQGPLRKIVQSGEILHMDASEKLSEDNLYFLDAMNSSAHRLRHLIFDLLKYIDLPRVPLDRTPLDLTALVKSCADACLADIQEENDFRLKALEVSELPIVWADKDAMETLFKALISNSLKFTKGDKPLEVSIVARQTSTHAHIDIIDNGIGIPHVTHVDVFDPFIRLNEKSAFAGSGFGLSVCRLISERHGWALDYKKDYSNGTFMTLTLPLTDCRPEL